ncbi:MAG: thiamine pyrophosphate-binding protein [Actinobacteria bacterium]|nr:thiamine pyrophosphate-binding protein [Actinomycetota bacterium]MBV9254688.1 thiamine pyrophosphate-binding protein [Actinomycetota bacterium]MBV9665952.1 thiamine pyrophosphate-binding protein [Actinomycetota bacterium]MBV9933493.1 thiamine pyrophosphate-binding protein [Actinomycetota bacterium]
MKGSEVLFEVLATEGVTHAFGNPGTTELPFVDALVEHPELHYVLALQEATAVAMADGYAQATGKPAFLNLHTSAGLGNAIGNLTNAQVANTPLVVTAGQQDLRHIATEPMLSGDLVGLARPVSKWAEEVRTVDELAVMLRRAFHDAAAPPGGPVFVSIPMNVLDEETATPVPAPSRVRAAEVPDAAVLEQLADLLVSTPPDRLALVLADEVGHAVDEILAVADTIGAPVFGAPLHATLVFLPRHPLWRGPLPPAAARINQALAGFDRVFAIGRRPFMVYPYTPGPAVPPTVELLHLSADAGEPGRTWPVTLGAVGDAKATLAALLPLVRERIGNPRPAPEARPDQLEDKARQRYADVPMHPMAAAHALVRALPDNAVVVDEAITTGTYVRGFHHPARPGTYFFCRGGGLGWGMPAALGVSLGYDKAPVLCVVGDGSAMYSPQALWTAAREQLPVVFAVVNNRQYLILKNNLRQRAGASAQSGRYVAMDLVEPPIDYLALARSMGVEATLVEKADDVSDAVSAAWDAGRPHLLELPISSPE